MKVFSSRYDRMAIREIQRQRSLNRPMSSVYGYSGQLLSPRLRIRLTYLLKHITTTDVYLEPFLLVKIGTSEKLELSTKNLKDFSEAELGYDITENLEASTMEIKQYDNDGEEQLDDSTLLDLLEVLVVLSKDDTRDDLIKRINGVFKDESSNLSINGWMIIPKNQTGISAMIPLIKNPTLKEKLNALRTPGLSMTAQSKARNAADAVQYIFSADKKSSTKTEAEQLLTNVAERWTDPERVDELYELLNQQVTLAKSFNNQIGNIRHTDKHTIEIDGPGMFDMIYKLNMSIVELAIVTEQEKYIEEKSAAELKQDYSKSYGVDVTQFVKRKVIERPIDLTEIPF